MMYERRTLRHWIWEVVACVCLVLPLASLSARATGTPLDQTATTEAHHAAQAVTPKKPLTPASIAETKPAEAAQPAHLPILIALNPNFVGSKQDKQTVIIAAPPALAQSTKSLTTPEEPQFLPLLKETENPADTQNRGTFIERHEFGIQLRSPF